MKPKLVVYRSVQEDVLKVLKEACEVVYFDKIDDLNRTLFMQALQSAEGLLGSGLKIDKPLLDQAPNLKIVSNISAGYDNLDLKLLMERHILATNTPGVLVDTTADAVFAILMAAARRIPELDGLVKGGRWQETIGTEWFGSDVHHKTLGIIGMGAIGSAIAKRAHFGFDMDILYHNRSRNEQVEQAYNAKYCELDDLLSRSDFICIMTPHSPETDKMIGEREFRLMKSSCIFVNGSRGKNVDEDALVKALSNRWIRAAGLDVYETEPLRKDHPLTKLPNVVTMPHIGSATVETRNKMAMLGAENVLKGLTGSIPPNLIT